MKTKFNWVWMDLFFPWFTGILIPILCTIAAIKTTQLAAIIVCAITGLVFLLAIPFWCIWMRMIRVPDYITRDNLHVFTEQKNNPTEEKVHSWLTSVIDFWYSKLLEVPTKPGMLTIDQATLLTTLSKEISPKIYFEDKEILYASGRSFSGYAYPEEAHIGFLDQGKHVESLFRHEFSHIILFRISPLTTEQEHHDLFKKVGLGA